MSLHLLFETSPNMYTLEKLKMQFLIFFPDESIDFLRNPSKTNGKHTKPSNVEKVSEVE